MSETDIFVGRCIYCGGPGETDEHIIPYALGGKHILRKASCEKCRSITSQWERNSIKENWVEARAALDYPSRHTNFNKQIFPLEVVLKDGTKTVLSLKREETFGLASFLEYPLPAFFGGPNNENGALVTGAMLIGFGPNSKAVAGKYGIKEISFTASHKGTHFERMIIRIAYCAAVATWGPDCLEENYALSVIMGTKDNVSFLMGCDPLGKIIPLIGKVGGDNYINVGVYQKKGDDKDYAVVRLKFFAASDAPEYLVVLGTLQKKKFSLQLLG